jgi:hypothetical protein
MSIVRDVDRKNTYIPPYLKRKQVFKPREQPSDRTPEAVCEVVERELPSNSQCFADVQKRSTPEQAKQM